MYFQQPTTIASFLHPLLFKRLRTPLQIATNLKIETNHQLIHWIAEGAVKTDGSEERVNLTPGTVSPAVGLAVQKGYSGRIFDDFAGLQSGVGPTLAADGYRLRRNKPSKNEKGG
jgi:hypothetical protein